MKRILFSGIIFCLGVCFLTSLVEAGELRGRRVSGPTLVAPGDNQDLSGKKTLEFRWSPEGDRSSFDHYDFRLYKGHETVEKGLILKRDIPAGEVLTKVDTATFENGETYAWSVRQVGARKSRPSYSVFKVIKK